MPAQRAVAAVGLALAATASAQRAPDTRLTADSPAGVEAQRRLREGEGLLKEDEFLDAARAFEAAVALDPDMMMAHYGLGRARTALKEYPGAIAAFVAAREAFQRRATELERRRTKIEGALADQLAALPVQSPRSPEALNAIRRAQEEKLERFRDESRRALRLPPGLTLALGSAYFRTGQLADAEREWRAALAADPTIAEARINLAVVLLMTGRASDARRELDLARKSGAKVPAGLEKDVEAAVAKASRP
jgi:tetratricopeptide (TPR) repeat protein